MNITEEITNGPDDETWDEMWHRLHKMRTVSHYRHQASMAWAAKDEFGNYDTMIGIELEKRYRYGS